MLCYAQPGGGYSVEDYANFHIYEHGEEGLGEKLQEKKRSEQRENKSKREKKREYYLWRMGICSTPK